MMADIIVLLIIIVFAVLGIKKGFIRSVVGILSFAASIVLAWILHPVVSEIMVSMGIDMTLTERIRESMMGYAVGGGELSMLPDAAAVAVESGQTELINATAGSVAGVVMNIVSFIAVLIIARIVIWIAVKLLNILSKMPVINGFNRIAGLLLGVFQGVAVVYIALALMVAFVPFGTNQNMNKLMENSSVAIVMYENNPIIDILMPESVSQGNGD